MSTSSPRARASQNAWVADVICGAIGGYAVFGTLGSVIGISFMLSAGEFYRRRRLYRARQLRELRAREVARRVKTRLG